MHLLQLTAGHLGIIRSHPHEWLSDLAASCHTENSPIHVDTRSETVIFSTHFSSRSAAKGMSIYSHLPEVKVSFEERIAGIIRGELIQGKPGICNPDCADSIAVPGGLFITGPLWFVFRAYACLA